MVSARLKIASGTSTICCNILFASWIQARGERPLKSLFYLPEVINGEQPGSSSEQQLECQHPAKTSPLVCSDYWALVFVAWTSLSCSEDFKAHLKFILLWKWKRRSSTRQAKNCNGLRQAYYTASGFSDSLFNTAWISSNCSHWYINSLSSKKSRLWSKKICAPGKTDCLCPQRTAE